MTPMEAWHNISARLEYARKCYLATYGGKGHTEEDTEAEIMAFRALQLMEQGVDGHKQGAEPCQRQD